MLRFDPVAREGYIEVSIDTTGLEANSARAQTTARGPGFFNVEKYPRVDFTSSRFVFEGNRLRSIGDDVTIRIAIVAFGDEAETNPAKVENIEKADQPRAAAPADAVEVPKRQSRTTK